MGNDDTRAFITETKRCGNCGKVLSQIKRHADDLSVQVVNEAFRCDSCDWIGAPMVTKSMTEYANYPENFDVTQ